MFTLSVSHNALKALALIAATRDDVRTCLQTIAIDLTTPGRVHLVATDGHRMLIVGNAVCEGDRVNGVYLIPVHVLKGMKQRGTERYPLPILITITPSTASNMPATYRIDGASVATGPLLDEKYPQWQRVLPKKREGQGKAANFNLEYVGSFARVAELLGVKYPQILQNGDNAARIYLGADAVGVVMPMRMTEACVGAWVDWLDAVAPEYITKHASKAA